MNSQEERERLKEQYKEHYRKMMDAKERLNRSRKTRNIADALHNMDKSDLFNTVDEFLHKLRSKLAHVEARLDVAMDDLTTKNEDVITPEQEDTMRKHRAEETLKQVKAEMGLLYSEIEQQAEDIRVKKTIGPEQVIEEKHSEAIPPEKKSESKKSPE